MSTRQLSLAWLRLRRRHDQRRGQRSASLDGRSALPLHSAARFERPEPSVRRFWKRGGRRSVVRSGGEALPDSEAAARSRRGRGSLASVGERNVHVQRALSALDVPGRVHVQRAALARTFGALDVPGRVHVAMPEERPAALWKDPRRFADLSSILMQRRHRQGSGFKAQHERPKNLYSQTSEFSGRSVINASSFPRCSPREVLRCIIIPKKAWDLYF